MFVCSTSLHAEPVTAISYVGNKVTKDYIIRQELGFNQGDDVNAAELEMTRQSVMDLGLFKSVTIEQQQNGQVIITVKEKSYLLLLPRFSRDSNTDKISPGLRLTVDNVAGRNQRFSLLYSKKDPENASSGDENNYGFSYSYPKMWGGNYNLDFSFDFLEAPINFVSTDETLSEYTRNDFDTRILISRWLEKTGPSTGWVLGGGVRLRKHSYSYESGLEGIIEDDDAISLQGQIYYTDVHDLLYSRSGVRYGYLIEQGLEELGSDYDFNRHLFYYQRYMKLGRPHHNLNIQARVGFSDGYDSNLNEEVYSIGGYGDLRAYNADDVEGAAFALLNIEYLRPVFDSDSGRMLLFADVGNAYARNSDLDFSGLKVAAGFGMRWKVKSFVRLDLSLEYAYNVDDETDKIYFRTSAPF